LYALTKAAQFVIAEAEKMVGSSNEPQTPAFAFGELQIQLSGVN